MSHDLKIDIKKALEEKLVKNEKKYPVDKSKGKHIKYNKLWIMVLYENTVGSGDIRNSPKVLTPWDK